MTVSLFTDRTILITGGAGFVGSHLANVLVDDNEVRVLDDLSTGTRANLPADVECIAGDIRDDDLLAEVTDGVDLIYHEAALVSVPRSVEEPRLSNEINAAATVNLLERAREEDARVVLASSAAIYGHPDAIPVTEDEPLTPASPYGVDKLTLDHYARLYNELYDLPTVALRYFNIYGPRQSSAYSAVIDVFWNQAIANEPITIEGDGEQTRDFVHVDDIVQANLLAATTEHVGEAYNIGTGASQTITELAETIREVTGSDSEIVHGAPREGDIRHSRPAIEKARADLGYEPTVSLEEGLETLLE